jgi:hypothetical protein
VKRNRPSTPRVRLARLSRLPSGMHGGVAALYALIHRLDLFGSAIIESPALEVGNGRL